MNAVKQNKRDAKNMYDGVEKVINKEQCNSLKFDDTEKWYNKNKAEFVPEKEMHTILWDFEIQSLF